MFSKDNLESYLTDAGVNVKSLTLMETAQGVYTVTSPDDETNAKVLEQLDRDEKHPVIMKGVKVISSVLSREDSTLTVQIKEVNRKEIV